MTFEELLDQALALLGEVVHHCPPLGRPMVVKSEEAAFDDEHIRAL